MKKKFNNCPDRINSILSLSINLLLHHLNNFNDLSYVLISTIHSSIYYIYIYNIISLHSSLASLVCTKKRNECNLGDLYWTYEKRDGDTFYSVQFDNNIYSNHKFIISNTLVYHRVVVSENILYLYIYNNQSVVYMTNEGQFKSVRYISPL